MKYKSGDKVVIVEQHQGSPFKRGSVVKIVEYTGCYYRVSDGVYTALCLDSELEIFKETQAPALASRHNNGKIRPTLFPVNVYKEVLKVFQFGANKYGDFNWQKGFRYRDCADSLERHWLDWKDGKDKDDESKLYHLAHIIANAAFLLYYQLMGTYTHLDNRIEKSNQPQGEQNNGQER